MRFVKYAISSCPDLIRASIDSKKMDCRVFASPKRLRPRRRVKPGNDSAA
jgi:hypothetical protein